MVVVVVESKYMKMFRFRMGCFAFGAVVEGHT